MMGRRFARFMSDFAKTRPVLVYDDLSVPVRFQQTISNLDLICLHRKDFNESNHGHDFNFTSFFNKLETKKLGEVFLFADQVTSTQSILKECVGRF